MFPIRCFTCGKVIGGKWEQYKNKTENNEEDVFNQIGIKKKCCIRMFISHVDNMNSLLLYKTPGMKGFGKFDSDIEPGKNISKEIYEKNKKIILKKYEKEVKVPNKEQEKIYCIGCTKKINIETIFIPFDKRENSIRDLKGENSIRDLKGENSIRDLKGENSIRDLKGENSIRDLKGENSIRDLKGENSIRDPKEEKVIYCSECDYWYCSKCILDFTDIYTEDNIKKEYETFIAITKCKCCLYVLDKNNKYNNFISKVNNIKI